MGRRGKYASRLQTRKHNVKADALITKLSKVRSNGRGSWSACRPAHDDKHPSLAIREEADGRVLVHCFAGCDIESILNAVGLDFDALFTDQVVSNRIPPQRWNPHHVLAAVSHELTIAYIVLSDVRRGVDVSDADLLRFDLAVLRIGAAEEMVKRA